MPPTLKTVTLGCKVNQYETEYVRQGLLDCGYRDARTGEPADLCIINTCTVTNEGDAKSRQLIRRMARDNPGAEVVVMGCYATRAPDQVATLPGVTDVVVDKRTLPDLLRRYGVIDVPRGIARFGERHRAFIKVQDGCYLRCSYCIIPLVRQPPFSRPPDEIVAEARTLVDNGYRELVLTGVHLGHYGIDRNRGRPKTDWVRLSNLVERLARLGGTYRIRLSSIEATEVTPPLIDVVARYPGRVCPHFHICLQSGSDRILKRMRRRWSTRTFIERCQTLSDRLDTPALTTDVIVGFPGETDADFAATCRIVREIGFSKIHVFPFSPRQGTPAAEMPDQVAHAVKKQRVREMVEVGGHLRAAYLKQLIGRPLRVMVETRVADQIGQFAGTAGRYVPVQLAASANLTGRLVDCLPTAVAAGRLVAPGPLRP